MYPSTQEQVIAFYTRSGHRLNIQHARLINDTSSFTVVGTRNHDQLKSNNANLHFFRYKVRDSSLQAFQMMLACADSSRSRMDLTCPAAVIESVEPAVWRTSTSHLAFRRIDACRMPVDNTHVKLGRGGQGFI